MKHTIFFLALAAMPALPATIINDQTFPTSNWSVVQVVSQNIGSSPYTPTQQTTGGNLTFYRDDVHSITRAVSAYTGASWFNGYTPTPYIFTAALSVVDASFDIIHFGANAVGYRLAVEQGGLYFAASPVATTSAWTTYMFSNLTATSFCQISSLANVAPNCASNPLWAAGSPTMTFGYINANSFDAATTSAASHSGIDNFTVSTTSAVPEPATGALLGASLITLVALRRRNRA